MNGIDTARSSTGRMTRRYSLVLGLALIMVTSAASAQPGAVYRDPRAPVAARVQDLLGQMTLEEKFWQLFMLPGSRDDSTHDYSHGVFGLQVSAFPDLRQSGSGRDSAVVSRGAAARSHAERINAIQKYLVERTRLGIPMIPFDEAVHGLTRDGATMFPAAIALAATWDSALVGRVATSIAQETRSRGVEECGRYCRPW